MRDIYKGYQAQVVLNQRNVGDQARGAFVDIHILKWLQRGQIHHRKKGLLKRVVNCGGVKHLRTTRLDPPGPL